MAETEEMLEKYPKGKYINKLIMFNCFATIKPWLDMELLSGYLVKYGIIKNSEDMELVTSPFYKPHDRMTSLMKLIERSGRSGFLAFYVGLNESAEESRGHADAAAEINRHVDQASSKFSPEPESEDGSNGASQDKDEPSPLPSRAAPKIRDANIDYQIVYLEDRFCTLSSSLYEELVEQNIKPKDVIKYMVSLPYNLKRELADSIKNNLSELRKTEEVDELHVFLDSQLWNFIDYYLLEHIINKLGSITLRSQMAEYVTELTEFMRKTTISNLIQFWPGRKDSPLQYTKVSVTVDLNPNECTLEQLNTMRKKLCEYFLPPLSEFAMLYYKFREGSVLVILLLTENLIPALIKGVCSSECYKFFEEQNIVSLCIKGITVYPLSANNPPPRNTKSEQLGDTYYSLTKQAQEYFYILSNPSLSRDKEYLTQALHDLIRQFIMYLQNKVVTIDHIIEAFPMLPTDMKSQYKSSLENLLHRKSSSMLASDQDYIQTFSLLKLAINEFGNDQLKGEMELYITRIRDLRKKIPLHHVLDTWKNDKLDKLPSSHTPISLNLQKDPISYTLGDLEALRLEFANEFKRCLSGPSSLILHGVARGSITVSWGVLRKDAKELNKELLKDTSREFFERNGVDQVSLHNHVAFDSSNLPAVLSFTKRSSITDISNAKRPCITINKEGWIIQTYKHSSFSSRLSYYRTGKLSNDGDKLDWAERVFPYSSGNHSKIQLNDKGIVVEVFQLSCPKRCLYSLGRLDVGNNEIKRVAAPFAFASGGKPSVALNNKGTVLVTFERGLIRKESCYGVGNVNETNGIISWQIGFIRFCNNCSEISSSLNDHGTVVFSARTYQRSFIFLVGKIESNRNDIALRTINDPSSRYGPYSYASVGLNGAGNIVWIKVQRKRVIVVTGRMIQSYVKKDSTLDCNLKLNIAKTLDRSIHCPSGCISNSDVVGFTYQIKHKILGHSSTVFTIAGRVMPEDSLELYEEQRAAFLPEQNL